MKDVKSANGIAGVQAPDAAGKMVPPPLVYAAGLALGYGLTLVFRNFFLRYQPVAILGLIPLLIGLLVAASALKKFGNHGTPVNPAKPAKNLVEDGPYGFSRNPMYLSLSLVYAGVALILSSLWSLLFLIPVLLIINYHVITREEMYLEQRFGEEYRAYKERVRKWI